jgi:hypothetical protein
MTTALGIRWGAAMIALATRTWLRSILAAHCLPMPLLLVSRL